MKTLGTICIALLMVLNVSAYAKQDKAKSSDKERTFSYMHETDTIKLTKFVEMAQKNIKSPIIIHAYARSNVVAKGSTLENLNYDSFGQILAANLMTVVKAGNHLVVVPFKAVRSDYPLTVGFRDDLPYKDWEWVSTTFTPKGQYRVSSILPVLRPLVLQSGHLAAHDPTNTIIVTAPYGAVKRIKQMMLAIDATSL